MWFIGVEEEQEMSAPPPKKNTGSAPEINLQKVVKQVIKLQVMYNLGIAVWTITTTLTY